MIKLSEEEFIERVLADRYGKSKRSPRGNCYVTCEALYHLLGKKHWTPMNVRHEGDSHWFLKHDSGLILDPTVSQFRTVPPYAKARGRGFLTRHPSKRACELMARLVWQ